MYCCTASIFKDHIYLFTPYFKSLLAEATKKYTQKILKREGLLILVRHPNVIWNSSREWAELHLELMMKTEEKW